MNKVLAIILLLLSLFTIATAAPLPSLNLELNAGGDTPQDLVGSLQILLLLTILTLAPAILILMTSFTRIVIVLGFVRNALATQQVPPNQVLIGLALFLTFFIMFPTWTQINDGALQPYLAEEISQQEAWEQVQQPIQQFMLRQTRKKDLQLFLDLEESTTAASSGDTSLMVLTPAFVISELKSAFQMGFMLYVPFLVIDMVVASTLMSMGMMMLPPVMISLPFKILLFILVDGWHLIVQSLVQSFN